MHCLILAALCACRISAAQTGFEPFNVTMDVGRGYFITTLKTLFHEAHVNYAFGGEVEAYAKGKMVTLHARDMSFRDALESLLIQVRHGEQGLTYRLENGVCIVSCRDDSDFVAEQIPGPEFYAKPLTTHYVSSGNFESLSYNVPKALLQAAGVNYVLCTPNGYEHMMPDGFGILRLGDALNLLAVGREEELKFRAVGNVVSVGAGVPADSDAVMNSNSSTNKIILDVSLDRCDLTDSLTALFAAGGMRGRLSSNIQNTVTAHLGKVSFRTAMETLLRCEPDMTYRFESFGISIGKKGTIGPTPVNPPIAKKERSISVDVENLPLDEALRVIARSAGVALDIEESARGWVMERRPVTMHTESTTLMDAAETLLQREDVQEIALQLQAFVRDSTLHVFCRLNLPQTPVAANLNNVNLDEALQEIFRQISAPYAYTVRDSLTQRFSSQFADLPFSRALYKVARSVHFPKVCTFDTVDDLIILYSSNYQARDEDPILTSERYTVRARDADVRYVLKTLLSTARLNYTLDQNIQGTISIDIRSRTLPDAIESVLHKISDSYTYRVENNVYSISVREETPPVEHNSRP